MSGKQVKSGSELFIVDNSDQDWKVLRYLREWCGLAEGMDIATGYFEIGSLLALDDEWQKVDHIRILMGDEVRAAPTPPSPKALSRSSAASMAASKRKKKRTISCAVFPPLSRLFATARFCVAFTARTSFMPRHISLTRARK